MEDFEPKEPVENNEFTMPELMIIHRALINEHIQICFPPLNKRDFEVANSASRKILNLITEKNDRQHKTNE
jgi:hypothetical protein